MHIGASSEHPLFSPKHQEILREGFDTSDTPHFFPRKRNIYVRPGSVARAPQYYKNTLASLQSFGDVKQLVIGAESDNPDERAWFKSHYGSECITSKSYFDVDPNLSFSAKLHYGEPYVRAGAKTKQEELVKMQAIETAAQKQGFTVDPTRSNWSV